MAHSVRLFVYDDVYADVTYVYDDVTYTEINKQGWMAHSVKL